VSPEAEPAPLTAADLRPVIERLDAVIGPLARVQPVNERANVSDRIRLLAHLGLDNATIAGIVGRGTDFVGVIVRRGAKAPRKGAARARKAKAKR